MAETPLPRLWCCAAADASIVAVFGRCHASVRPERESRSQPQPPGTRWSCILRWDWKKAAVTEGSWTTMELRPLRAVVSKCGEYLLYHAKTNDDGPFSARNGPRFAISRLPWLAALTHPQSFGPGGAGTSQYALPKAHQQRLWSMFPGFFWGQTEEEWPRHLTAGPLTNEGARGWHSLSLDDAMFGGSDLARYLRPANSPEGAPAALPPHLIAVHPIVLDPVSGAQVYLLAAAPRASGGLGTGWNVWEGQLRFFVLVRAGELARIEPLDGVRWAKPTADGLLLTASADARLRASRWKGGRAASEWIVEQEHDLSKLKPRPAPPPREALGGLR